MVLCDVGSHLQGYFVNYLNKEIGCKIVRSSPYYSQGNSINECSHNVLNHAISVELQSNGCKIVKYLLSDATFAYNVSIHGSLNMSPSHAVFGKAVFVPRCQDCADSVPEGSRLVELRNNRCLRMVSSIITKWKPEPAPSIDNKVGAYILYQLSLAECRVHNRVVSGSLPDKRTPTWSFPAEVLEVKNSVVVVLEVGFTRSKQVPVTKCFVIPNDKQAPIQRSVNHRHLDMTHPVVSKHPPLFPTDKKIVE